MAAAPSQRNQLGDQFKGAASVGFAEHRIGDGCVAAMSWAFQEALTHCNNGD
jgi:hypothetical protein